MNLLFISSRIHKTFLGFQLCYGMLDDNSTVIVFTVAIFCITRNMFYISNLAPFDIEIVFRYKICY